jgi:hypothetical protein
LSEHRASGTTGETIVTASTAEIYERHIQTLPAAQRLELLALIASRLVAEGAATPREKKHRLEELRGVGKEIWEGIDAQEYVNRLRGPYPDEVP